MTKLIVVIIFLFTAINSAAWEIDLFGNNKRKQEIAEEDARIKAEVAKWDSICEVCKSEVNRSLPNGIRVLDWRGMCAPSKTSTGHSTMISALISGGQLVHATCYTDHSYKIIDFRLTN